MAEPFGYELLLDCYGCDKFTADGGHLIDDVTHVYNFLEEAIVVLDVTKQAPPYVFRTTKEFLDKVGISAWIPLVESGIQVHTIVPKNYVSIDYFTCTIIDDWMEENLMQLAKRYFFPRRMDKRLILRGIEYNDI
jgi:S-adenosylmethionine/arginine decarboxylase-like enzyme